MSTSLTPYAAAKRVNVVLEMVGLPVLPPQMFYNYTTAKVRAGKKPLLPVDDEGRIVIEGLDEWLARYLVKKGVKDPRATTPVVEVDHAYLL